MLKKLRFIDEVYVGPPWKPVFKCLGEPRVNKNINKYIHTYIINVTGIIVSH